MPLSNLSPKELEALEAELAMTLADDTLPFETRNELVRRLNVIKAKLAGLKPQ